jgi:hypothetical protein
MGRRERDGVGRKWKSVVREKDGNDPEEGFEFMFVDVLFGHKLVAKSRDAIRVGAALLVVVVCCVHRQFPRSTATVAFHTYPPSQLQ